MTDHVSTLKVVLEDDVTKPARSIAQALGQTEKQAQAVAKAFAGSGASDRLISGLTKLGVAGKDLEKVAGSWRDYTKSAEVAAKSSKLVETQILDSVRAVKREQQAFAQAQRAAIDAARHKAEEVARAAEQEAAAVARASAREAAAVEAAARREIAAQHKAMEQRQHAIARGGMGHMALTGAATYTSAHSVLERIEHAVKAGAELQHERVALMNAGQGAHMPEIEARAREVAKTVPTSTVAENLKVINETISAFGSLHHALENLDFMQKTTSILHASAGDKIHDGPGELGYKFAKFFEMRGTAGNSEVFRREAGEMVRAMAFSRGNFNPHGMLQFAQQTESLLPNYSMRFLSRITPSLITEMGDRAGTRANAWSNTIMGKARDQKQAKAWMDLGLLDPKQTDMKNGAPVAWKPGAIKDTKLALSDNLEWTEKVLIPALQNHGVDTTDNFQLTKALNLLFRNSEANRWATAITQAQSRARLHKDEGGIDNAGTNEEIYKRNLAQDPTVAFTALTAAIENLTSAATSPAMGTAATAITGVANALQSLAGVAQNHPLAAMTAGAGVGAAALGGAGYLSYQFVTGFGLSGAATALDGSAVALTEAATALTGAAGAGGAGRLALGTTGALGTLTTVGSVVLPLLAAVGLTTYMADHKFGHVDPQDYLHNNYKNIDALPGVDDDEPAPPAPTKSAPTRSPSSASNPFGDLSGVTGLKAKADEAKTSLDALNGTVNPVVDGTSLDAALAKANALASVLRSLNGLASGVSAAVAGINAPNLGAARRGSFSPAGDPGR